MLTHIDTLILKYVLYKCEINIEHRNIHIFYNKCLKLT